MKIELRKMPYPYQAALTICSDLDGTSLQNFIEIHKFLNTKQHTSFGSGLNMPIGNSFWMYDNPEIADSAFSYFVEPEGKISADAPLIRDFIKAGILDVMHGYGNFAKVSDFSRAYAEKALEELNKYRLKIDVWTNHGGIESMQNIGVKSHGMGDEPETDFYHADLLLEYGIRFFWDSEVSLMSNIGQDCDASFGEAYWNTPLYQDRKHWLKSALKGGLTVADNIFNRFSGKHFIHWEAFDRNQNDLIHPEILRDGNELLKFRRVGLGRYDWSDDLPMLLNDHVLKRLIEKEGYLILYIHLGDRRYKFDSVPLSAETVETLNYLSELYHDGKIWVATTSRMLNYNFIQKSLKWTTVEEGDTVKIKLQDDQSETGRDILTKEDLAGLTFYVPENKKVQLLLYNVPLKFNRNPKDITGIESISIPIKPLEWPL